MADELTIKVSAKLDEGSVNAIQSQLDGIGNNKKDGIKLKLDVGINKQIANLKKQLNDISAKTYPIKFQIDQTAISNIQNLTDSLNKAVANVQNSISRSNINQSAGSIVGPGHYTGMTSYSVTRVDGTDVKEVEKYNDALGEQRTIIRDLQSEEQKETEIVTTNYEAKAKAREKAAKDEQKYQDDMTKLFIQARQKQAKEEAKAEKEARDYERREQEKALKEEERLTKQQQKEQERIQFERDREQSSLSSFFIGKGEDTDRTIENWKSKIEDLYTDAFKLENPLTGEFAKPVDEAINTIRQKVSDLESSGVLVTSKMKDQINSEIKAIGRLYEEQYDKNYPDTKQKSVDTRESIERYTSRLNKSENELQKMGMLSEQLKANIDEVRQGFASVGQEDSDSLGQWVDKFGTLQQRIAEFKSSVEGQSMKLNFEIESDKLSQIDALTEKLNSLPDSLSGSGVATAKEELAALATEYQNVMSQLQSGDLTQEQFNSLAKQAEELNNRLGQVTNAAKIFNDGFKNTQDVQKYEQRVSGIRDNFEKLQRTYADLIQKNPEIATRFEEIGNHIQNIDPMSVGAVSSEVTNLGRACSNAAGEASGLRGALEGAFGGVGQYLARFTSAFYIINKGISTIKSMVNEVTELDTSLMELQKVTTLSGDSLAQFTDNAYKTGKEVGRTGKDVIDAVTTFSRAGYNLEESNQLAKAALTMTNVGVDIPSTEAAASDMISILKAFDKQADESMQVIDELYNVANKEPLDFGNITQMLVTAGGTLAQTNTSLEETMGLLTGGFATLRDTSVANGLIMISQRLRGVKEDGEAIEEEGFMPKLKKAFSDVGISIEDQNGELRSTYDILNDLAGVWDQLSSKQRQYLGEKAAGNRQVKTLNAIMSNWDVVQDTIQKANEATGEATKGNEKYLDSIEGRITQFKSAFSDLARTTIDSDFVKGLIGGATNVTEFVTSIGGLVPVLSTITGSLVAIKGLKIAKGLEGIGTAIKGIVTNMAGANGLVGALTSIPGAIGLTIAALGAFTLVASAISNSKKSIDDYVEGSSKAKQNYEDQTSKVEGLNAELENTQKLISDLENKPSLTVLEEDQLSRLKDTNKELEDRIKLEKQLTRIAEIDMRKAAVDAVNAYKENTKTGKSTLGIKNNIQPSDYLFRALGADRVERGASGEVNVQGAIRPVFTQQDINELNKEALVALRSQISEEKKLLSEQGLYESKRLNQLQDDYNSTLVALKEYYDFLDGQIGNTHRVENPVTTDEKDINALHDEKQALDDLFVSVSELNKTEESNRIFEKYSQDITTIKDIIKEAGEITEGQLKEQFSGVFNEFIASGWEAEDVVRHINEELKSVSGETNLRDIKSVEELITNNYLASDSYKALSTAMTEQQKAGTISMETYQKLIESDQQLANALTLTADGYALNSDAVNEYIQSKTNEQKIQALLAYDEQMQKLEELKKRYEELNNATIKTDDIISELAKNQDAQDAAERDMEAIEAYIRELDAATGALARFKAAQSSANQDANFQETSKIYSVIKEGNKTGKRNTDDYQSAVDYVLGDNWRDNLSQFGGSVEAAYKHAEKLSKRYSGQKDERVGATNFMKDLDKNGFGTYDSKTGSFELTEDASLDAMSEKLQVSKDYLIDMFNLLNTYSEKGKEFTFPEMFSDDDKTAVEEKKKQLAEIEKSQEQMGDKIEDVNKQIENANERGDEKEAQRLEQQKKRYEDAQKVLEQEHTNIENGVEMDVDTMTLEDAKKKIDELYETISALNGAGIDIPVTIADEYNTLLDTFPQLRGELQKQLPPIVVRAEDEALPKLVVVDGKIKELEGDHFVDIDVKDNGTTDEVKTGIENVENDDYNAKVNAGLGTDTATGDIQAIENGPYDSTINVQQIGAETAGNEIDEAAKNRETTITVKYNLENDNVGDLEEGQLSENGVVTDLTETQLQHWRDKQESMGRDPNTIPLVAADVVEVSYEANEKSVENMNNQVQDAITGETFEFNPEFAGTDEWGLFGEGEGQTVNVQTEASNPEEPIQQVQDAADGNPVEVTFKANDSVDIGNATNDLIDKANKSGVGGTDGGKAAIADLQKAYVQLSKAREKASSVDIGDESGAAQAASELQTAASEFMTAYNNLSQMTSTLSVDPIEVDADTTAALKKVQAIADKGVTIDVSGNTTSLASAIESYNNRTITVNVQTNEIGGNAKGTRSADPGLSLVDEKGAELIEHTRRGTYELGTNNGPRITNLEAGDVVHTASETKRILSRMAKIGGFFRGGLNQAKSVLTGGAFADAGVVSKGSASVKLNSSKKKSSSKKSGSKKSGGSKTPDIKKLQEWFEKLFDWAEVRLDRLQRKTNEWIYSAGQAIGYAAQNAQLSGAMKSVEDQIRDTTAAMKLYEDQAEIVRKKTKLTDATIEKIQNGTIDISSYSKNSQERIRQYTEWYEKMLDCKEALQDLNEQQKELATQKLDNIIKSFEDRANVYENTINRRSAQMNLNTAMGIEKQESDYEESITAANNQLKTYVQEREALNNELNSLVAQGYIKKDSEEWFEYQGKIADLDTTIINTKESIIELHDVANQVNLTKLGYQLDALTNSASHLDEMMSLRQAQANEEYAESYKTLVDNGMNQIKNLQAQNAEYRKQQQGLDVMSEKYQELESNIQSNISAINQMKTSQEVWNDSVYDIQIDKINDFKDQLSKTNDLYERQKNLQDAIQELEKAQSQRTQRVFREGGLRPFVW